MTRVVLFVCTGNVCRSPMAAGLLNAKIQREGDGGTIVAQSAGTWALEGQPASENAATVMAERGIELADHRGRTVTRGWLAQAAVVIVMTRSHREALNAEFPEFQRKIHLMSELKNRAAGIQTLEFDIADPYGGPLTEYRSCALTLERLIDRGYFTIKTWITSSAH